MINIFGQADQLVSRSQISNWLKKDDDSEHQPCDDRILACYLNGLINEMRGKKTQPPISAVITNEPARRYRGGPPGLPAEGAATGG